MPRIEPLNPEELPQFAGLWQMVEATMGFVPTSLSTMARLPDMLPLFAQLNGTIMMGGSLPQELKLLVAYAASRAAGCRYCQAHTSAHAAHLGVAPEKIAAVWEFETSEHFSDAETAALRLAIGGGQTPAHVSDEIFDALRAHFSDAEICELVAVIAMFGFLNRWNDIIGTRLEDAPLAFAEQYLAKGGWTLGHHGG